MSGESVSGRILAIDDETKPVNSLPFILIGRNSISERKIPFLEMK